MSPKFLEVLRPWPPPFSLPGRKEFQWEGKLFNTAKPYVYESAGHWVWCLKGCFSSSKERGGRLACQRAAIWRTIALLQGQGQCCPFVVVCGNAACLPGLVSQGWIIAWPVPLFSTTLAHTKAATGP